MTYDIYLEKPIPDYAKAGLDIKKEDVTSGGEFMYTICFANETDHDEFCELIYSILDINGSEEATA